MTGFPFDNATGYVYKELNDNSLKRAAPSKFTGYAQMARPNIAKKASSM
jgi:hypothetical protein